MAKLGWNGIHLLTSPLLSPIPTDLTFHSAWWKVPTLNQTFHLEVRVSIFTFSHSGFTIVSHTCSVSTCTFNPSVYIKGLTQINLGYFWPLLLYSFGHRRIAADFSIIFPVHPKEFGNNRGNKEIRIIFYIFQAVCKLRAGNNVLQARKSALEQFRFLCSTLYLTPAAAPETCTSAAIILSLKVDLGFESWWTNPFSLQPGAAHDSALEVQAQLCPSSELIPNNRGLVPWTQQLLGEMQLLALLFSCCFLTPQIPFCVLPLQW